MSTRSRSRSSASASTQRRLLEWETAAASAARAAGAAARSGARLFLAEMIASPRSLCRRPRSWSRSCARRALPVAAAHRWLLWAAAPLVAYALSRPVVRSRAELDDEDRAVSSATIARKTWRYFETFMGAEDHGLPPDNFQESPGAADRAPHVAHQHRHGPARDARRPRPRLHRRRDELESRGRRHARPPWRASSASKAICSTGTTRRTWRRCCRLRVHRRQRQPRRRAHDAGGRPAAGGARDAWRGARGRVRGRHELPLPLRPAAPHPLHRLPPRRRRGAGPPRSFVLRPARLGGAAGQLHRHRQGRPARDALVPPRAARHQRATARRRCCRGARRCSST